MTCDLFTSSREPVAESSPISSSAIPPSLPSKSIPTVATSSDSAAMMAGFQGSPSTKPISVNLTHPSTPEEWISSQAASLARISPPLAEGRASRASGPDSGASLPGLLASFDPATSSWKTAQCSLFADSMSSSLTLPRSGSMRNGTLYQRPRLALPISERESGFWQTLQWPTPTVCGNYNRKGASATSGDGLATVVAKYATSNDQIGGQLNPAWVCWLMNWPLNWFDGVKK